MGKMTPEKLTCRDRVFKRLLHAKCSPSPWVPSTELCRPKIGGIDFRRRIHELRKAGFLIFARRVPGWTWNEYRLSVN